MACGTSEHKHKGDCSTTAQSCETGKTCETGSSCSKKSSCCPVKMLFCILISTVIFTIIASSVQYLIWHVIFSDVVMAGDLAKVWRSMEDPLWKLMPFTTLLEGFLFTIVFMALYSGLSWCVAPGACKGAKFGMIISLIPAIYGAVTSYIVYPITPAVSFAVFCDYFFSLTIAGAVFGAMHACCSARKNKNCQKNSCETSEE